MRIIGFFTYIIVGGFIALGYAFYEMLWLSPRGQDKVSLIKKERDRIKKVGR